MKKRFLSVACGFLAIVSCLCLMVATEHRAYAYVDPGSGFLVLQSIASVMAATAYFLRSRIKALFGALFTRNPQPKIEKPTLVLPVTLGKNDSRSDSRNAA